MPAGSARLSGGAVQGAAGPGETVADGGGQAQVGLGGGRAELLQLDLGPLFQVGVVGDAHHVAAAGGEVLFQPVQVHGALAARADGGQHHDGVAHQVAVAVRVQPVEGGAGRPGPVHGRGADQDDLVGQGKHAGHGRVQQAGTAVGDADRVVVLEHACDIGVVR